MAGSGPKVTGHPGMANIMAFAQHRQKTRETQQKMEHDLLKKQVHADKTKFDIKKMRAQMEADDAKVSTQAKLMKVKSKAQMEAHEMKKQDFDLQHQTKKKDLDYQRKSFDLEKRRTTFKQNAYKKAQDAKQNKQTGHKDSKPRKGSTGVKKNNRSVS